MARTALAVQTAVRAGLTPVFSAANVDGHSFANDGHVFLEVKNTNAATRNVTIQTPGTVDGLAVDELIVTVGATTGDKIIGPFPINIYNQTGSVVYVDFSAVVGVTVAAIKVP